MMTRNVAAEPMTCVICGCKEDDPCQPNSCGWTLGSPALCSACAEFLVNVRPFRRLLAILRACRLSRGVFELLAAIGRPETRRKRRRR